MTEIYRQNEDAVRDGLLKMYAEAGTNYSLRNEIWEKLIKFERERVAKELEAEREKLRNFVKDE